MFLFIIAIILFVGGMYLTGFAFSLEAWEGVVFAAGILCVSAALAIPVHFAQRR